MALRDENNQTLETQMVRGRAPRRVYRRPIGVLVHGHYEICDALLLSENGILFETLNVVASGTLVLCTLIMPGDASVVVRAQINFVKKKGSSLRLGAEFLNVDLQTRRKIRNYVAAKTLDEVETEESIE